LTGCRLSDARLAEWREVNKARKTWTIPSERFKSKVAHIVPLTDQMLALLDSIPAHGEWLFTHDGELAMNSFSKAKYKVDALMGNPAPWINHDLRRVVRSHLSALKVPDHIAEMVCGRGRKGVQRIYDRHTYEVEIREALTKWNDRLAELVFAN
jgi:integrase